MKMKYCPECGSIQLQSSFNELKCRKCGFSGTMKEDSVDVINAFVQNKKNPVLVQANSNSFQATKLIMEQENPKELSLKERVKKLGLEDIEIL
ncbi:MAG: hypothetical protein ABH986_04320 [archaeon]